MATPTLRGRELRARALQGSEAREAVSWGRHCSGSGGAVGGPVGYTDGRRGKLKLMRRGLRGTGAVAVAWAVAAQSEAPVEPAGHTEVLRTALGQSEQALGVVPQRTPRRPRCPGCCRTRRVWAGRRGGKQLETWRMAQATDVQPGQWRGSRRPGGFRRSHRGSRRGKLWAQALWGSKAQKGGGAVSWAPALRG